MIGVVAKLSIQAGKGTEFEALANQLVEKVIAIEEGIIYYDLYKEDETTYFFLERYKDEAALDYHRTTDYYKSIGAQLGAFMAGAPEIKVLKAV